MKKIAKYILLIGIIIIIIFSLGRFGTIFTFWFVLDEIRDILVNSLDLDYYIAQSIATLFAFLITFYGIKLLFSIKPVKFKIGIAIFSLIVIFYSITLFMVRKDYNFNLQGEAIKCEAYNPYKKIFEECPCKYNRHPEYGTVVRKVGFFLERIIPNEDTPFFSTNGEPIVFYFIHPNNEIELFNNTGKHPSLNGEILPITIEIATKIKEYMNDSPEMIVGYIESRIPQRVIPTLQSNFFGKNGKPLIYYYKHKNGQLELFNCPGYHPQLGIKLKAVDDIVSFEILEALKSNNHKLVKIQVPENILGNNKAAFLEKIKENSKNFDLILYDNVDYAQKNQLRFEFNVNSELRFISYINLKRYKIALIETGIKILNKETKNIIFKDWEYLIYSKIKNEPIYKKRTVNKYYTTGWWLWKKRHSYTEQESYFDHFEFIINDLTILNYYQDEEELFAKLTNILTNLKNN